MDNSNYFKRLFRTDNQLYVCFVYKGKNYLIKNKSNKYLSDELLLLFTQEGHITKESCN